MKERFKKLINYILVILLMLTAIYIFIYYQLASIVQDLRTFPTVFLIAVIIYILAQLLKQYILKKRPWYDWLYYIGFIAIIIPLPLFSLQGNWIFPVVRFGSLFLLLSPLIEFIILLKKKPPIEEEAKE